MKTWSIVTLAIVVAIIGAPVLAEFTTWLPPAIRAALLRVAPPVILALVLVAYFNWRERLKRRVLADNARDQEMARAA